MIQAATTTKGYYSILQYVPDPERAEGLNIGLILLCPEMGFFRIQTAERNDRVRRFFGRHRSSMADFSRLDAFKTAFIERVEMEADRIRTLEAFRDFVKTRANQLRLTDPRPVKVEDPEAELSNLFALLVEEKTQDHTRSQRATTAIKKQFNQLLASHNLDDLVTKDVSIELPLLGPKRYPFAFKNGQPNVIEPETFELHSQREIIDRACRVVIEGQDLNKQEQPIKLNILGSFKSGQNERVRQVRYILEESQIALYTVDEMEKLIEVIAETAHT